jgi:aminoglycoside 6'-N-acetyltransferase
MPHDLVLRRAVMDDLPTLLRWDEEPHVIESDPNDDWNWEVELAHEPPWREQLVAELSGRPIGFVQIIDPALEEDHYWGDVGPGLRAIDIWIGEADCLGRGYGTTMMELALLRCFEAPDVTAVLIDPLLSNKSAQRFYARMGFEVVGPRTFGLDTCLVMTLSRERWTERVAIRGAERG